MKNKFSLAHFLKIRESEKKLVTRLFIFEFFQGAAIALFFTAAITLFLQNYAAGELTKVFVLASLLLWSFSFLYNKLEHSISTKNLVFIILIFNSLSILVFRLLIHEYDEWFFYLMLAFFYLLYLLNNLEFWGLVALLFDVRQSKRLFAIVSGGDIPAKMIGYLLAAFLVPVFGTENLLWIAFTCMVFTLGLFFSISNLREFKKLSHTNHQQHHHHTKHHYATEKIKHIINSIKKSELIRTLSLVSFFSFCFYLIASFIFYGFIKKMFQSDKSMAGFFGIFLAASRGLTLVLKLVFTNRLLDKIGLKRSLMLTPVLLMALSILAIYYSTRTNGMTSFYLFGIMAIAVDVLRSAIQSPVMLATLQPLPSHQRLRGHTLIKGLMDPFAFFLSGLGLYFLIDIQHQIDFTTLSIILFLITVLWILFSFFVDKHYVRMLTNAIHKRMLNEREISITDKDSIKILLSKMETGNEKEALAILHLANSQDIDHTLFFERALSHSSMLVRQQAINYIKEKEHKLLLPVLKNMLKKEEDPQQLSNIISAVSILDTNEDISEFFLHEDQAVINAAVIAIINNPESFQKNEASEYLETLMESKLEENKTNALRILKGLNNLSTYSASILTYLNDPNEKIKGLTLDLIASSGEPKLVAAVFQQFIAEDNDSIYLNTLFKSGKSCLPAIENHLKGIKTVDIKRRKIFKLLGKIGGAESMRILENNLTTFPVDADIILSSLHQLHFHSNGNQVELKQLLNNYLNTSAKIIFHIKTLMYQPEIYNLTIRALNLELKELRQKCLFVFSFLFDVQKIKKAMAGFEMNSKESNANAFELIEMTVDKEFASKFCIIHEATEFEYKFNALKTLYNHNTLSEVEVISNILIDKKNTYSDWTKACLLYSLKNKPKLIEEEHFKPHQSSDNKLVAETADFIAALFNNSSKVPGQ